MSAVAGEEGVAQSKPRGQAEGHVEVLATRHVVPARRLSSRAAAGEERAYLSAMDLFWRDIHYNMRVLFYEYEDEDEGGEGRFREEVVGRLKEGLAEVLAEFYPLAGRLLREGDRFVIDCNDRGVEFVEASIRQDFRAFRRSGFDMQPFFLRLARHAHLTRSDDPDLPLLSVQVTRFLEGGYSIGLSHSHVALDGPAFWHFVVSWSERTRGLPLSTPPVHDRTLFKPEEVSTELAKLMPFELVPMSPYLVGMYEKGVLVEKVFNFSEEAMRRIKGWGLEAQANGEGPRRGASSLEGLFSHAWRRVTRARCLDAKTEVSLIVLADWRRSRRGAAPPPVPKGYVGNAITWTYTSAEAGELVAESYPATLARVVAEVDRCTSASTLQGHIHWLELHDTRLQLGPMWFPGITMNVASSPRFPVYDVDFGWGPPLVVRPIRVGALAEICLFPGHPARGGGVDLCIKLDSASMQRLVDDRLFIPTTSSQP